MRDGNPKHIKGWGDLVKPGVQVITPNPFTSGGARWNVMAAYGAQRRAGKTDKQAIAYLYKLFKHVPVQPDSARAALQIFAQGKGDVLLTYENEAIYAEQKGVHTEYKTPKATLLIETPVALTKTGLKKPAAKAFYKYLWSTTAQKAFAGAGLPAGREERRARARTSTRRPASSRSPRPKLGLNGWTKVNQRFFHPQKGIMAKIEKVAWPADAAVVDGPARACSRAAAGRRRRAGARDRLPEHRRPAAARRARLGLARPGAGGVLAPGDRARRRSPR